jgi:hypothetical protein
MCMRGNRFTHMCTKSGANKPSIPPLHAVSTHKRLVAYKYESLFNEPIPEGISAQILLLSRDLRGRTETGERRALSACSPVALHEVRTRTLLGSCFRNVQQMRERRVYSKTGKSCYAAMLAWEQAHPNLHVTFLLKSGAVGCTYKLVSCTRPVSGSNFVSEMELLLSHLSKE